MKTSIIIPMYNESKYISRCLDSLKNQTYKDFELILIDDGSKDNTIVIAKWYDKDFNLTILQQKNSGPWTARNRWAREAKWDILIFVDADMRFDEKYIEELIKPILDAKEIWTSHWREYVANLENKIARAFSNIRVIYNKNNIRWWVYRAVLRKNFLDSWWFETSRWYADDNLSKLWWSLIIERAIVYHNNPESLWEIFKHSIWVWTSLWKTWDIIIYLRKYKLSLMLFFVVLIILLFVFLKQWIIYLLPIGIILLSILFLIFKAIQRTFKEKYLSNIIFVPIVMITRWLGYIAWAIKYMLFKKLY